MTALQGLLLMLGVLPLLVLFCAAVIFLERKFPSKKYDERQKIARGNSYRLGYGVSVVYYLAVMGYLLFGMEKEKTVEPYLLIFAGYVLQLMVSHIYCMLTHAALPLSEKPGLTIVGYLFCGFLQLTIVDYSKPFPLIGRGSQAWVHLAAGVFFIALAVMHIISLLLREKE